MRGLTLGVGFSCSSGPDGGLLSDPVAPFLEETIEVPMWVESSSSLSGLSTVDFFPVFPRVFSPGVVKGFDFAGLVASGSSELEPAQSFHSFLSSSHSGICAMRVGVPPCSLALCGASWLVASGLAVCLITAGLASMDGPQLVSSVESQLCE